MYKNQLQELAQRSCFNLPSYTCIREGPDHAPRFKATVNFNGETFESPHYCSTLRQAEHSAAEVALQSLSNRGPSHSLAARILPWGVIGVSLRRRLGRRTFRTVELAGIKFTGEPAKNKKQAEKNAAMAAWTSLKLLAKETASSSEPENNDELEQITIARALLNYRIKEKMAMSNSSNGPILFTKKFPSQNLRPTSPQPPATTSKILPLICPKLVTRNRSMSAATNDKPILTSSQISVAEGRGVRPQKFPAAGAAPYVPIRQLRTPCHGIAPPVTIRTAVPVFSAPPRPAPSAVSPQPPASAVPTHPAQSVVPPHQSPSPLPTQVLRAPVRIAPPVTIRQALPVFSSPPIHKEDKQSIPVRNEDAVTVTASALPNNSPAQAEESASKTSKNLRESETVPSLEELKI
ncbi:hypothetical protein V6N12_064949 [Hibiscus sabdariffa]|uniref:DRBM domain-containing protein n=1 Tax=Hibiscus sabdariffa TaxID=183260 RepID=A0ABR2G788_9ROSI